MLDLVRKHAQSWLVKLLFWLLVLTFVVEFGYMRGVEKANSSKGVVARVNGEKISYQEYQKSYDNLYQFYQRIYKKKIPAEVLKNLNLEKKALEGIILRNLLLDAARKEGVQINDQEILRRIKKTLGVKKGDKFNREIYLRVLRANRMEAKTFEESIKNDLLIEKLEKLIKAQTKITKKEIFALYREDNESVNTEYFAFDPLSLISEKIESKEEEIKAYYQKHKEEFKTREKIKVEYLLFRPLDYQKSIIPDEEEIKEYYQEHLNDYTLKKRVKARHILFKVSSSADTKTVETVRKKAEAVLKEIKGGGDFAELARKYSEDKGTAVKGGDLGYFAQGEMVKPFEEAAFSLKKGEISGLVKSVFGYHIIKVEAIKEGLVKSLSEAKRGIKDKLKKEGAYKRARREARKFFKKISVRQEDFKKAIKGLPLELKTSDFFSREEKFSLVPDKIFRDRAFAAPTGKWSEPFEVKQGFCLLRPVERQAAVFKTLEKVSEQIREELLKDKQEKKIVLKLDEIKQGLREGKKPEELFPGREITFKKTGFFKRKEAIPGIGNNQEYTKKAFRVEKGKLELVKDKDKYYLFRVIEKKDITEVKFKEEEKKFSDNFVSNKKNISYQLFLQELKNKARIEIFDERLKGKI